MSKVRKAYAGG